MDRGWGGVCYVTARGSAGADCYELHTCQVSRRGLSYGRAGSPRSVVSSARGGAPPVFTPVDYIRTSTYKQTRRFVTRKSVNPGSYDESSSPMTWIVCSITVVLVICPSVGVQALSPRPPSPSPSPSPCTVSSLSSQRTPVTVVEMLASG